MVSLDHVSLRHQRISVYNSTKMEIISYHSGLFATYVTKFSDTETMAEEGKNKMTAADHGFLFPSSSVIPKGLCKI